MDAPCVMVFLPDALENLTMRSTISCWILEAHVEGGPPEALLFGIVHVVLVDHVGRREQCDHQHEVAEDLEPCTVNEVNKSLRQRWYRSSTKA